MALISDARFGDSEFHEYFKRGNITGFILDSEPFQPPRLTFARFIVGLQLHFFGAGARMSSIVVEADVTASPILKTALVDVWVKERGGMG